MNDFSCQRGMNYIITRFSKGDTSANWEYLFERQKDFDADIVQPHYDFETFNKIEEREEFELGKEYSPAKDKTNFSDYYRRLEDITDEYIEDYIANLCFSIFNKSGSNGAVSYNAQHRLQPTLVSVDDDDVTELADLQVREDPDDWSNAAKVVARDNLPFVLKRLHNLSRYCGVHMLSMIGAYLRAKSINDRKVQTNQSKSVLKKNAVIAEGVYKCDSEGNIGMQIEVSNKSRRAADMFDWIVGANSMYPSYRDDLNNLLQYCKILNVDLIHDDLRKYDNEFIDSLTVLTLTPDSQYCPSVYDAIRDSNLLGSPNSSEDLCLTTMSCFRDICTSNEELLDVINNHDSLKSASYMQKAKQLFMIWSLKVRQPAVYVDTNMCSWENGFLCFDGELVILDTCLISNGALTCPKFIISELGYCIHLNDTMYVEAMTIDCAYDNMYNKYMKRDADYIESDWVWFQ